MPILLWPERGRPLPTTSVMVAQCTPPYPPLEPQHHHHHPLHRSEPLPTPGAKYLASAQIFAPLVVNISGPAAAKQPIPFALALDTLPLPLAVFSGQSALVPPFRPR